MIDHHWCVYIMGLLIVNQCLQEITDDDKMVRICIILQQESWKSCPCGIHPAPGVCCHNNTQYAIPGNDKTS